MWYWPLIISIYTFETFNRIGRLFLNMVSMPYVGLTSFLHPSKSDEDYGVAMCQCPMSGSHHFYCLFILSVLLGLCGVSMPYVGLTSFLPYPFKTSVFMRVSCPVFSCIFLNFQIFWYNKAKKWAKLRLYF